MWPVCSPGWRSEYSAGQGCLSGLKKSRWAASGWRPETKLCGEIAGLEGS